MSLRNKHIPSSLLGNSPTAAGGRREPTAGPRGPLVGWEQVTSFGDRLGIW